MEGLRSEKRDDLAAVRWRRWFQGPHGDLVFGVHAIPQTFTIDADGVLQDQHIGDASMEGKLKKLVSQAREFQVAQSPKP